MKNLCICSGKYDVGVPSLNKSEKQESDQAQSKAAQEKRQALIKTIRHRVCDDYPELFNKADPKPFLLRGSFGFQSF